MNYAIYYSMFNILLYWTSLYLYIAILLYWTIYIQLKSTFQYIVLISWLLMMVLEIYPSGKPKIKCLIFGYIHWDPWLRGTNSLTSRSRVPYSIKSNTYLYILQALIILMSESYNRLIFTQSLSMIIHT